MSCQDFPRQYEEKHKAQRIELLEEDNRDLREREKNLKRISEEFARLLESLQLEVDQLRGKLADAEKQSREYLQVVEGLQDENRQMRYRIEEFTESRLSISKDTETDILKAELEKGKLREEIYQLKQEIDATKLREANHDNLKEREHAVRMKEMELTMIAGTFERRLKEEQQFHRDTMKKYEQQIDRLEKRADQLQEKKMLKENMLADAYSKLKEFEIENTSLMKKISVLENSMQQEKDKVKNKYCQELDSFKKENEGLKQQLKAKDIENKFTQHETKKILLQEKAKNNVLQQSVNKVKNNYEHKSSLIIRQLLTKQEQITSLKRQLSRSRSKNNTRPGPPQAPQTDRETTQNSSPKTIRLNSQAGLSNGKDKYSTVHSSLISDTHRQTIKANKELFKSRQNRQIAFIVEKNPLHRPK